MSTSEDVMRVLCNPTVDILTAGRVLGIGRDAARKAARSGQIPAIKVGAQFRVPTAKLREMLGFPNSPQSISEPKVA